MKAQEEAMGDVVRRSAARAARWTLLVALVVGVAGMHTLGHLDHGRGHGGHGGPVFAGPVLDHASASIHAPAAPGTAASIRWTTDPGDGPPGLDPTSVCLAVLSALLLFLVAAGRARMRPSTRAATRPGQAPLVTRPPPQPVAVRLACLSVLRI
ncbi:hypothetical protein HS048_21425 [Planomonospora sp. ID91781]|uniref:DUF6153 family protein n=1 Tax=Planomonospora sp. ID91781 TaxID=2738135 RepID=UPI0018C43F5D|nr:DUF6153 family protein [Planomonospora sp. ID91781]MBG0823296.1 hypothetical protein [Planomonospora sp. ID91781]